MREKGLERVVKLASNENPLGPSPKAMLAASDSLAQAHRYVDVGARELVNKLARMYNREPEEIVCGHGTDSILANIIVAFTDAGDELLTTEAAFIGIFVSTNKLGRKLITVPMKDYCFDLPAIAEAVTPSTKIVYLANPNNPTGTMFSKEEFESFMDRVPSEILVILDEAYTLYACECDGYPDGLKYRYDNLIVTRSLSKAYGLAGLRVGFAAGPAKLIGEIYKVKLPFEPNIVAQKAAIAALDDEDFLRRTTATNRSSLQRMKERFTELSMRYVDTVANFYLLLFPTSEIALTFYEECLNRGLIVRPTGAFGIPNGIRINSGTEEETDFALEVIEQVNSLLQQPSGEVTENSKA